MGAITPINGNYFASRPRGRPVRECSRLQSVTRDRLG